MNNPLKQSAWSCRYGDRHRYLPILDDPLLPNSRRGRIRIYQRGKNDKPNIQRFILNWFEGGRNCKRTVLGDKFTAVAEADRINQRLDSLGRSGLAGRQISLSLLIERYTEHLNKRADAGEISARSAVRYKNALSYLLQFADESAGISRAQTGKVDDSFVLEFKAYLRNLKVHPNGHPNAQLKPLSEAGIRFILSAVRSVWQWALEHNPPLLPEESGNPFRKHVGSRSPRNLVTPPDLNTSDIVKLIQTADRYQLILLMPLILYGLRAAEPCFLMVEDWNCKDHLLTVSCVPDLDYKTKSRIDKVFPVPPILDRLLRLATKGRPGGPLLPSRAHFESGEVASLLLATKQQMAQEYHKRLDGHCSAASRLKVLANLFHDAGGVSYDQLSHEFQQMVGCANLTSHPTLKSLRHFFAAALEKANISYFTRKYFMGHRVRRDPLAVYTSINFDEIRSEFDRLLNGPMAPIITATVLRMGTLAKK